MKDIEEILNKNENIKEWLNGWDCKKFAKKGDNDLSINECIKRCTSPVKIEESDSEEFIKEKILIIFKALTLFKPKETRILIIGQDPYPNQKRAHGLAFSFGDNSKPADDSLLNIYKAIEECKRANNVKIEKKITEWDTNLEKWATTNKVLLLNTALTYNKKDKKENRIADWKPFINEIILNLLKVKKGRKLVVFLWGDDARKLFHKIIYNEKDNTNEIENIDSNNILVLSTSHPSNNYKAVYKGFCYEAPNHFKACDEFLEDKVWLDFPENNKLD